MFADCIWNLILKEPGQKNYKEWRLDASKSSERKLMQQKLSVLIYSNGVFSFLRRLLLLWIYGWNFAFSFHPPCYNLLLSMKGENRLNYAAIMQKYILPGFLDVIVLSTFLFYFKFPSSC